MTYYPDEAPSRRLSCFRMPFPRLRPGSGPLPSLVLAGALLAAPGLEAQSTLHADTVFRIPGGPQVLLKQALDSDVVSLRIFVPLEEGTAEAGFAQVLQLARLEGLRPLARRVGARIGGVRTRVGISYTASGTSADLDYLAWLLRQAVGRPGLERGAVERARIRVQAEVERDLETPRGLLTDRLRRRVWPSRPSLHGSRSSLARVSPGALEEFWARTHQPDSMVVVAVGPLEPVMLLSVLGSLGSEIADRGPPLSAPAAGAELEPDPQILRSWLGRAWVVQDGTDPRPAVAAVLLADRLRSRAEGSFEASVELWEAGPTSAIVVIAAAYPRNAGAMRRTLEELLPEAASGVTGEELSRAVSAVRGDLLLNQGAPWSLAALMGHYAEGTGDPQGAEHVLDALDRLDAGAMRNFLRSLEEAPSIRQELSP